MKKHKKASKWAVSTWTAALTILGVCYTPDELRAAPPSSTALGNGGEIFAVHTGSSNELLPDQPGADRAIAVLDVTRPGEETVRLAIPPTLGAAVESSAGLIYSRETGALNIVWQSEIAGESSVLVYRFDDSGFAESVDEVYYDPSGAHPMMELTHDEFHVEIDDTTELRAERQILHLVWPQDEGGQSTLGYTPVILMNGAYIGTQDTLSLPHLDADANESGDGSMAPILRVKVRDDDHDRLTLIFGSSQSGRVTAYNLEIVSMDVSHLGEIVRDFVRDEGFDPGEVASFIDGLGVRIISVGRTLRSRTLLTPTVLDFIAAGSQQWVQDHSAEYDVGDVEAFAFDLQQTTLALATGLLTPAPAAAAPKSVRAESVGSKFSGLVIDGGDLPGDDPSSAPTHFLELRFAVELPVPDSAGSTIELMTSEDGERFLAAWLDPEAPDVVRYVESQPDGTWSEPLMLELGSVGTIEDTRTLLQLRLR